MTSYMVFALDIHEKTYRMGWVRWQVVLRVLFVNNIQWL